MTTEKKDPKDIDFLVVVDHEVSLEPLARIGRKVKGHAQNLNRGADTFLADPRGRYIGRTCSWIRCGPGIRRSCDALHCGRWHYLHDDLQTVSLSDEAVRSGVELWPVVGGSAITRLLKRDEYGQRTHAIHQITRKNTK